MGLRLGLRLGLGIEFGSKSEIESCKAKRVAHEPKSKSCRGNHRTFETRKGLQGPRRRPSKPRQILVEPIWRLVEPETELECAHLEKCSRVMLDEPK